MGVYGWLVLGHVIAVILGLAAHGVSAFAMFRVRTERDPVKLAVVLELSSSSLAIASIGLLVAIVLGIAAAIMGGHFAKFWPWAAIIILVVIIGSMTPLAGMPMNRVRKALGLAVQGDKPTDPPRAPASPEELAAALDAVRPEIPAAIGIAGIVVLSWLMRAKPF